MAVAMTDLQRVRATLAITNAAGNPAPVDGPPIWATTIPNVVDLSVDPDGMAAWLTSVGSGSTELVVTADANLDPSVRTDIEARATVTVLPSQAVGLAIVFGAPEPKP